MGTGRKGNYCQKMQSRVSWKQGATMRGKEKSSVRLSCGQSLEILPHKSMYHAGATLCSPDAAEGPLEQITAGQIKVRT